MRIIEIINEGGSSFTDEEKALVKKYLDLGYTRKQISQETGIAINRVANMLAKKFPNRTKDKTKISQKEKALVKKYLDLGYTQQQISDKTGMNYYRVGRIKKQNFRDLVRTKKEYTDEEKALVKKYLDLGYQRAEIAKATGISVPRVARILKKKFPDREISDLSHTDEEKALIKHYLDLGYNQADISRETGIDHQRIASIVSKEFTNYKQARRKFTQEEISYARERYRQGESYTQLASSLERDSSVIASTLKRQQDYHTLLLPDHLANAEKIAGVSKVEHTFFQLLSKIPGMPSLKRNTPIRDSARARPYNVDGYDVTTNTIIEFYGSLYHADPRKYPDDNHLIKLVSATAGAIRAKDRVRIQNLKALGYRVIIVWEYDFMNKATRQRCLDRVAKALGVNRQGNNDEN